MPDAIIMHFKNSPHISARGTAPIYYFTIVWYERLKGDIALLLFYIIINNANNAK